jgi:hypothetical protein
MEARRAPAAEKEAAARRATEAQILEDAGRLVAAWNERQSKRMPMLFAPTVGCALKRGIGFCGCAARLAALLRRSTSGPSIAILGLRSPALSRRCPVVAAGRTRRSPSLSASLTKASPTKCARSMRGALSNDNNSGPAAMLAPRSRSLKISASRML